LKKQTNKQKKTPSHSSNVLFENAFILVSFHVALFGLYRKRNAFRAVFMANKTSFKPKNIWQTFTCYHLS